MTETANAQSAEETIRRYLVFLEDPSKLIDVTAVERQAQVAKSADDPIERLRAFAELERIKTVDGEALLAAFVAVVLAWAADNKIPVAAFRELGVPYSALEAAGFERSGRQGSSPSGERGRSRDKAALSRPGRSRAVSVQSIQETMLAFADPFTLTEVMAKTGGSSAAVRKAAEDLCAASSLSKLGPDPEHRRPGRAPGRFVVPQPSALLPPAGTPPCALGINAHRQTL